MTNFLYRVDGYADKHIPFYADGSRQLLSAEGVTMFKFTVLRETPCGYWFFGWGGKHKFVRKYGKKRFAYETRELAMESYKYRKKRQERYLKDLLSKVQRSLRVANRKRLNLEKMERAVTW